MFFPTPCPRDDIANIRTSLAEAVENFSSHYRFAALVFPPHFPAHAAHPASLILIQLQALSLICNTRSNERNKVHNDPLTKRIKVLILQQNPTNTYKQPAMTQDQIARKIAAFRADLEARGESISDFCRRKGLDYYATHMVLSGRSTGKRGKAHKAAVALGLKSGRAA